MLESAALPPALAPGKEPGWYPAADNPNSQLYWDGQAWAGRRKWTAAGFQSLPLVPEVVPNAAPRVHVGGAQTRSPAFGATIGLVGALLLLLSFTTLTWADSGLLAKDFAFLHALSGLPGPGLAKAYFGWLAITGFIITAAVVIIARLNTPVAVPLRALGAALGLTFAALTFAALAVDNSIHDVFTYAGAGFWTAIVGFLCIGAAAII